MESEKGNYHLVEQTTENQILIQSKNKCDKYDYLVAVACGAVGGLIDVFFVGAPNDSTLGNWTDKQVDKIVMEFARKTGWTPREGKENSVASAIGFLERNSRVNYDQRYTSDVKEMFNMNTKNHHMMSLAHAPDIVGLFFSVLNQFTSTASFIANGQIITIKTDTFELQGTNFISKIFCGIANWLGHIMSDIAGSSGGRGSTVGRGSGVVIPFYEMFQFCKFGKFQVGKARQDLATIAIRAFQEGYDFRFGMAMAIPVIITDLSIRLIWSLRRYFQYGYALKECIPTSRHADLRMMLLLGNGTLCVIDGMDAGIRSGGDFLRFFTRLNLIAWFRFAMLVLKEVCIRVGLKDALTETIEAYKRINAALLEYLHELELIDIEAFERETEEYNKVVRIITNAKTNQELNTILLDMFDEMEIRKPWQGDFDKHMSNKGATLYFE